MIEAIAGQDFAIVRSMVFLGALLYIASYIADRHRLHLGRPAGAAGLSTPSACRKFVFLWTDVVALGDAARCSSGTSGGCAAARNLRATWARCCATRRALGASIVLAAVRDRDAARQRALPARAAGARRARRRARDVLRTAHRVAARPGAGAARSRPARPPIRGRSPTRPSPRSRCERDGQARARLRRGCSSAARTSTDPDAQWAGDVARAACSPGSPAALAVAAAGGAARRLR